MKLLRFLRLVVFSTIVAVVYIQLQTQIIELAYQAKAKEKQIRRLKDEQGRIVHDILMLKSPTYLGVKLLDDASRMKFLDQGSIVKLESNEIFEEQIHQKAGERRTRPNFLATLFSLKSQAEAKPLE